MTKQLLWVATNNAIPIKRSSNKGCTIVVIDQEETLQISASIYCRAF